MSEPADGPIEIRALSLSPGDDREYERVVTAEVALDGPRGELRVERRYEALPRHNDVVDPAAVDSNDDLLARADAVHVYTQWFDEAGYLGDGHAIWEPAEPSSVLADDEAFAAACRDHVERTAARTYAAGFER